MACAMLSKHTMSQSSQRKLFALVYTDESGNERRNWYESRKEAELVGYVGKREFRIEEFVVGKGQTGGQFPAQQDDAA